MVFPRCYLLLRSYFYPANQKSNIQKWYHTRKSKLLCLKAAKQKVPPLLISYRSPGIELTYPHTLHSLKLLPGNHKHRPMPGPFWKRNLL